MHRRRFLKCIAAASITPAFSTACKKSVVDFGPLETDPGQLLDLPRSFNYTIVSKVGDPMSDGLRVPAAHDGMAAFARDDGRVAIVCNHELLAGWPEAGPFAAGFDRVPESVRKRLYDRGSDDTPAIGGTTTTIWNPESRKTERQFLSLCGTEINCAGGATPWGSWLSCEEAFSSPGPDVVYEKSITRDQRHGYIFEVSADADELVDPVPLTAMGRFEHEAAAIDPSTGVVYLTEDRRDSLLYRFVPNRPGELHHGGRLQALAVRGRPAIQTANQEESPAVHLNDPLRTYWIDIDDPDPDENTVRLTGAALGAAIFSRGEGLCWAEDRIAFTCTSGGPAGLGQVFTFRPVSDDEGELELIAEAQPESLLHRADNLTQAPWGDLLVCEDRSDGRNKLVGIRPDGSQYLVARNNYSESELAGVCFSPDGKTLFLNVQYPGTTVAITGPLPG